MKELKGKTALITGAAGGLGSALARALAERGCHLALADINPETLCKLRESLDYPDLTISTHVVDLCSRVAITQLATEVQHDHSKLHILINCAGITLQKSIESHSDADWQRVFDLNFWATVHICRQFIPRLRAEGMGHIVNLSSMAACYGIPSQGSYCSSKAAVQAFSETLRAELQIDNIGVTCVNPGAINTDMMKATLHESDDIELAQTNMALARKFSIEPDAAARKILAAITRNQSQLFIGMDARLFSLLSKCAPSLLSVVFARAFSKVGKRRTAQTNP